MNTRSPALVHPAIRLALLFFLVSSCWSSRGAKTPTDAQKRLADAVAEQDPAQLWRALDLDTQWSWMTIHRAGRESYDITLSHFPEGTQRERLIRKYEPAATSENAATLFAKTLPQDTWSKLTTQLTAAGAQSPTVNTLGTEAEIAWTNGRLRFRMATENKFGWGFSGLADQANDLKRSASADLEALRTSAADYERAATRGLR